MLGIEIPRSNPFEDLTSRTVHEVKKTIYDIGKKLPNPRLVVGLLVAGALILSGAPIARASENVNGLINVTEVCGGEGHGIAITNKLGELAPVDPRFRVVPLLFDSKTALTYEIALRSNNDTFMGVIPSVTGEYPAMKIEKGHSFAIWTVIVPEGTELNIDSQQTQVIHYVKFTPGGCSARVLAR